VNALSESVFWFLIELEQDDTPEVVLALAKKVGLPEFVLKQLPLYRDPWDFLIRRETFLCGIRDACVNAEDREAIEHLIAIERDKQRSRRSSMLAGLGISCGEDEIGNPPKPPARAER
jgi:hypothetical protein